MEADCKSRMCVIQTWYECKKREINMDYELERKSALNEFDEKRKELKESLKAEYEEKRRLIEIEKNLLDINLDNTEVKPTVTRKLRRRANEQASANVTSTSILLSSTSSNTNVLNCSNSLVNATSAHHHHHHHGSAVAAVILHNNNHQHNAYKPDYEQ